MNMSLQPLRTQQELLLGGEVIGSSYKEMPSLAEQQVISQEAEKIGEEMDALDDEIARLYAIRMSKNAAVNRLHSLIAPHKKLPPDVLALIFQHTLSDPQHPPKPLLIPSMIHRRSSPWNIRHVCSYWRQVALSRNTLWNNVAFEWSDKEKSSFKWDPLYRWRIRIRKAGRLLLPTEGPLHLEFCCDHDDEQSTVPDDALDFAMEFLRTREKRVTSLTLRWVLTFYECISLYNSHKLNLPNLQHFSCVSLWARDVADEAELNPVTSYAEAFFERIPKIQSLKFSGDSPAVHQYLHFVEVSGIASNLTSLHLLYEGFEPEFGWSYWERFARALSQCVKLKSLTLLLHARLLAAPSQPPMMTPTHITLPELKSLTLYSVEPFVFNSFTLPSLSFLCYKSGSIFRIDELISLLRRSQCSLQTFVEYIHLNDVDRVPISDRQWNEFLTLLHPVKEFRTMTLFDINDIKRLGKGKILPKLEQLDIQVDKGVVLDIFDLLKKRMVHPTSVEQAQWTGRIHTLDILYVEKTLFFNEQERLKLLADREKAQAMGTRIAYKLTGRERFRKKLPPTGSS